VSAPELESLRPGIPAATFSATLFTVSVPLIPVPLAVSASGLQRPFAVQLGGHARPPVAAL
jgi:hypothetical protein